MRSGLGRNRLKADPGTAKLGPLSGGEAGRSDERWVSLYLSATHETRRKVDRAVAAADKSSGESSAEQKNKGKAKKDKAGKKQKQRSAAAGSGGGVGSKDKPGQGKAAS